MSQYSTMIHIFPNNSQMIHSKASPQIYSKSKIFSSNIDPHHHQQNLSGHLIQVYKKNTNNLLELTFAPRYMCIYALLTCVIIPYWLEKHAHGGILLIILYSIFPLKPFMSCITSYGTPYTILIWMRIIPTPRINFPPARTSISLFSHEVFHEKSDFYLGGSFR